MNRGKVELGDRGEELGPTPSFMMQWNCDQNTRGYDDRGMQLALAPGRMAPCGPSFLPKGVIGHLHDPTNYTWTDGKLLDTRRKWFSVVPGMEKFIEQLAEQSSL